MTRQSLQLSILCALLALSGCPQRTTVRLIGGKVSPSRYVSPTAYEHYLRAELHAQRGNHREAVRELRAALVFDDEAPYLHARLAESLIALHELRTAAAEVRRGLEIDSDHPDVLLAATRLALSEERFGDAESALRRCTKGSVLDERCHLRLATLLARRGRVAEARSILDKLVARTASPAALVSHAKICLSALDLSCAAQKLEEALARRRSSRWLLLLARVQQAAGKWGAATKSWRRVFDQSRGSLQVARPLLTTLQLANDKKGIDDLLGVLERQVKARGAGSAAFVELMLRARRPRRALAFLAQVKRRGPQEELARARTLAHLERRKEAHTLLSKLINGPLSGEAALQAARLHERAGERQDALSSLAGAQQRKSGARGLTRERARLLIDSGQIAEGLALVRRAVIASKGDKRARLGLAVALLRAGRWPEAVKEAEDILKKSPDYAPALNFIGFTLTTQGKKMRHAHELLQRANQLAPLEAYIIDSLGFWQLRAGQWRRAAKLLEIAYRLDPLESEIAAHLAEARFALGQKAAALVLIRHAMLHADDARLAARLRARLSQLEGRRARKSAP